MSWYYIDASGTTLGPVAESDLAAQWRSKGINAESYVWNGTTVNDWTPLKNVSFLYNKFNKPAAPAAAPPRGGRPAAGGRPKKKAGGGARMNLLDSIRSGKTLNKVAKKDLPAAAGGTAPSGGSGGRGKPKGKMSLQDQLKAKLGNRSKVGGPKKTSPSKPMASSSGSQRSAGTPSWKKKQSAASPATKKFGSSAASKSSGGGSKPSKFDLKKKIDSCNEDWILRAIAKLLD